jgi:hypothetical protein
VIVDYASLQTELQSWLWNRSDVVARIPVFIQLAEAQMNRRLQTRLSVARVDISIAAETLAVPADFAGAISILLLIDPVSELSFVTPDGLALRENGVADTAGNPDCYSIVGGAFQFFPMPGAAVAAKLIYRQRIPALSDSVPTNWLLLAHPDAYLYGALMQSAPWLRNDERLPMWQAAFAQILSDIQSNSDNVESVAANLTPQSGVAII